MKVNNLGLIITSLYKLRSSTYCQAKTTKILAMDYCKVHLRKFNL